MYGLFLFAELLLDLLNELKAYARDVRDLLVGEMQLGEEVSDKLLLGFSEAFFEALFEAFGVAHKGRLRGGLNKLQKRGSEAARK